MAKRKTFAASQKAAMGLEALKEAKTEAQIASKKGEYPNQIHNMIQ